MDTYLNFLGGNLTVFGVTIEYWAIIAIALFLACIAAWLFSKKL